MNMGVVFVWVVVSMYGQCEGSGVGGLERMGVSIFVGTLTGLASSLIFGLMLGCLVGYMKRTPILKGPVVFSPSIPPKTLLQAVNQGVLISGTYSKALLDNGLTVAVKRLEAARPSRQAQRHLEMLATLRHNNLMRLRAYLNITHMCLVYDYVPTGSLQDAMRDKRMHLTWDIRLNIALGIVSALHYLHFCCPTPVLHYSLKPANVMLDADFQPRLTDYGLANIVPSYPPSYSDKSDVFSFGVTLVFLLTGRDPEWLRGVMQGGGDGREALDKCMVSGAQAQEQYEMLMALRIALLCLSDLPAHRPSTDELVSMLTQLNSF